MMATKMAPWQVSSTYAGFGSLQDELWFLDEFRELNVSYTYDTNGNIQTETVTDNSTPPITLKTTTYTYNPDNTTATETVTKGDLTMVKVYSYDTSSNLIGVKIRKR